ncbi:hypothetical protein K523DRAFT_163487 [Schizophyllum commune Tattone D]|nr:hypothetical protein K523DRAFT_163487 [Schizophyllum commune Tattone D]
MTCRAPALRHCRQDQTVAQIGCRCGVNYGLLVASGWCGVLSSAAGAMEGAGIQEFGDLGSIRPLDLLGFGSSPRLSPLPCLFPFALLAYLSRLRCLFPLTRLPCLFPLTVVPSLVWITLLIFLDHGLL